MIWSTAFDDSFELFFVFAVRWLIRQSFADMHWQHPTPWSKSSPMGSILRLVEKLSS